MIRRPPRSTLDRSSAASDVYKRQVEYPDGKTIVFTLSKPSAVFLDVLADSNIFYILPVSYTHLRAHETVLDLVCRLLLEKKKHNHITITYTRHTQTKNIQYHIT